MNLSYNRWQSIDLSQLDNAVVSSFQSLNTLESFDPDPSTSTVTDTKIRVTCNGNKNDYMVTVLQTTNY